MQEAPGPLPRSCSLAIKPVSAHPVLLSGALPSWGGTWHLFSLGFTWFLPAHFFNLPGLNSSPALEQVDCSPSLVSPAKLMNKHSITSRTSLVKVLDRVDARAASCVTGRVQPSSGFDIFLLTWLPTHPDCNTLTRIPGCKCGACAPHAGQMPTAFVFKLRIFYPLSTEKLCKFTINRSFLFLFMFFHFYQL